MQSPGLAPLVEGDHVDPHFLGDFGHALAMELPHPPPHISLGSLAVTTRRSTQSDPQVVALVRIERPHFSWQRGLTAMYRAKLDQVGVAGP